MLTWTFQKVSKIFFLVSSFLDLANRLGNGRNGTTGGMGSLEIFFGGPLLSIGAAALSFSTERSFCYFDSYLASLALRGPSSSCLPLLKLIALAFSFRFIAIWEWSLPDPWASNLPIVFANWLTWVSKFFIIILVSCWNCKVLEAKVLSISSKDSPKFYEAY